MEFVNGFKITPMRLEERFVINCAKCLPECGGFLDGGEAEAEPGPAVALRWWLVKRTRRSSPYFI